MVGLIFQLQDVEGSYSSLQLRITAKEGKATCFNLPFSRFFSLPATANAPSYRNISRKPNREWSQKGDCTIARRAEMRVGVYLSRLLGDGAC